MTFLELLSTKQKMFKIINEFDITDNSYYLVFINVDEIKYNDNNYYYDISYEYKFNGNKKSEKILHPFYNGKDIEEHFESVIVYKNKMTETMVEYLLSNTEDLEKIIGETTEQCYRINVMLCLAKLWD